MRESLPSVPERRFARLAHCLNEMAAHFSARLQTDERGLFIAGFRSDALRERVVAGNDHEPGVWPWYEGQAAKLVFRVLIADKAAAKRSVAEAFAVDPWAGEEELLRRAKELARASWPEGCYA